MIWNLIGTIGGKVLDIVDDVVEDKDEANRLKFQIQRQLIETKSSELEAQAKIVLAEAQGSWLRKPRDQFDVWRGSLPPLLLSPAGGATRGGRHRGPGGVLEAELQYATRRRHGEQVCLPGPSRKPPRIKQRDLC